MKSKLIELDDAVQQASGQPNFLFTSSHKSIKASGIFAKVTAPASGGEQTDSVFQQSIAKALDRAQCAGIKNPIVMGAIPFDVTQPSHLYVPQEFQFIDRESVTSKNVAEDDETLSVLGTRSVPDEKRFKQAVKQTIANFHYSDIRKAVLSRFFELDLSQAVNVDKIFSKLVSQNPCGFHFRFPMADGSELIGASPELLIRKVGGKIVSNPLAGSAKRQRDTAKDLEISESLLNSAKDAYEHKLVIDDIRRVLCAHCKQLDIPSTPELIHTPAMWHLSTMIKAELNTPHMSALQLACQLHPTPAVCGFPTNQARKLINLVESYDRGLYTGMVGWCDAQGDGEWVVTIRCGTVKERQVRLFAGGGIVADSSPDAEWQETKAKLGTMLSALGINQRVEV